MPGFGIKQCRDRNRQTENPDQYGIELNHLVMMPLISHFMQEKTA
jgi:hypothetical protein